MLSNKSHGYTLSLLDLIVGNSVCHPTEQVLSQQLRFLEHALIAAILGNELLLRSRDPTLSEQWSSLYKHRATGMSIRCLVPFLKMLVLMPEGGRGDHHIAGAYCIINSQMMINAN